MKDLRVGSWPTFRIGGPSSGPTHPLDLNFFSEPAFIFPNSGQYPGNCHVTDSTSHVINFEYVSRVILEKRFFD